MGNGDSITSNVLGKRRDRGGGEQGKASFRKPFLPFPMLQRHSPSNISRTASASIAAAMTTRGARGGIPGPIPLT